MTNRDPDQYALDEVRKILGNDHAIGDFRDHLGWLKQSGMSGGSAVASILKWLNDRNHFDYEADPDCVHMNEAWDEIREAALRLGSYAPIRSILKLLQQIGAQRKVS